MTFTLAVLAIILTIIAIFSRGLDQLTNELENLALEPVKPKNDYERGMVELCRRVRQKKEKETGKVNSFIFFGPMAVMMWVMLLLCALT
jgi:hypothetical protein